MVWFTDAIERMDKVANSVMNKLRDTDEAEEIARFYESMTSRTNPAYMFNPVKIKEYVYAVGESSSMRDYLDDVCVSFMLRTTPIDLNRIIVQVAHVLGDIYRPSKTILPEDWINTIGSENSVTRNFLDSNKWYLVPLLLSLKEIREEYEKPSYEEFTEDSETSVSDASFRYSRSRRAGPHKHLAHSDDPVGERPVVQRQNPYQS